MVSLILSLMTLILFLHEYSLSVCTSPNLSSSYTLSGSQSPNGKYALRFETYSHEMRNESYRCYAKGILTKNQWVGRSLMINPANTRIIYWNLYETDGFCSSADYSSYWVDDAHVNIDGHLLCIYGVGYDYRFGW